MGPTPDERPRWSAAGHAAPVAHSNGPTQAIRTPLPMVERLVIGSLFGTTLTMAIANNPDWAHYFDLGGFLPARYVDLLAVLPVATNTAVAFVLLNLVTLAILFAARDPVLPLGIVTALSLGLATYPYGRIRWHRLVLEIGTTADAPGVLQWVRVGIPVLLLAALPLMLHVRRLHDQYREKGLDSTDTTRLTQHLTQSAMVTGLVAVGISLTMGLLLRLGAVVARQTDLLRDNSLIVIALVTLLLVLALAVGAGIFGSPPVDEAEGRGDPSEHDRQADVRDADRVDT